MRIAGAAVSKGGLDHVRRQGVQSAGRRRKRDRSRLGRCAAAIPGRAVRLIEQCVGKDSIETGVKTRFAIMAMIRTDNEPSWLLQCPSQVCDAVNAANNIANPHRFY